MPSSGPPRTDLSTPASSETDLSPPASLETGLPSSITWDTDLPRLSSLRTDLPPRSSPRTGLPPWSPWGTDLPPWSPWGTDLPTITYTFPPWSPWTRTSQKTFEPMTSSSAVPGTRESVEPGTDISSLTERTKLPTDHTGQPVTSTTTEKYFSRQRPQRPAWELPVESSAVATW